MKGIELAEVRDTIVRAFNADEFDMLLYERLDFDRPSAVADGPFKKVVTDVLLQFEREGREPYLIAEVAAVRPLRADVQEVYRKYALHLVGEVYEGKVKGNQLEVLEKYGLKVLEKYGLAPAVEWQKAGKPQLPQAVPATHEGFQKRVRADLPFLNPYTFAVEQIKNTRRVCRVEVDGSPLGTGFLVGRDAVLTNYHVLKDLIDGQAGGERVVCRFDYHVGDGGGVREGKPVALKGAFADWHLDSSPPLTDPQENAGNPVPTPDQLDHALVRLAEEVGAEPIYADYPDGPKRGWVKVPPGPPALGVDAPVFILQHPNTAPAKLALDTKAILSVNPNRTRVRYTTNTDQGSSGSPCFNEDWGLLALHHFGDPLHQKAEFNQGIPIDTIRARLTREGKAGHLGGEPPT